MIEIRPSEQRGQTRIDWLDSHHSFSFADYFDPDRMGWGPLRVINDDLIEPSAGFDTHGHRDMEIVTWVLDGAIAHRDSMGNVTRIEAGEVQHMSAGAGVMHSEFNPDGQRPCRLLQIWFLPRSRGIPPAYGQRAISGEALNNQWCLLVSGDGREDSLPMHQAADLFATQLDAGHRLTHRFKPGRLGYLQVTGGVLQVGELRLEDGDGLVIKDEAVLEVTAASAASGVLFDLPAH